MTSTTLKLMVTLLLLVPVLTFSKAAFRLDLLELASGGGGDGDSFAFDYIKCGWYCFWNDGNNGQTLLSSMHLRLPHNSSSCISWCSHLQTIRYRLHHSTTPRRFVGGGLCNQCNSRIWCRCSQLDFADGTSLIFTGGADKLLRLIPHSQLDGLCGCWCEPTKQTVNFGVASQTTNL